MTKTEDHIITDEEARAQWGVAGQTEEQDLRDVICDALGFNRGSKYPAVGELARLIRHRESALIDRIAANHYSEDLGTYDYDGIAEEVLSIKASIKQEGGE